MWYGESCDIEDVMNFACELEIGSIFTLELLINMYSSEEGLWSRITEANRENLQSQWSAWATDGLVLTQGQLEAYGTLISGQELYRIIEWHGDSDE